MAKKTAKKSQKATKSAKPSGKAKPKAKPAKTAKPAKAAARAKASDAATKPAKSEAKSEVKPGPKAAKADAKAKGGKGADGAAAKVASESAIKAGSGKVDVKADHKADHKADPKADPKADSKSDAKADSKASSKGAAAKAAPAKGAGGKVPAAKTGGEDGDIDDGLDDLALEDGLVDRADGKAAAADADKKSARKGITIVTPKPVKKSKVGPTAATIVPPGLSAFLLKGLGRKPLIPSGPKAAATRPLGAHGGGVVEEPPRPPAKTPFSKKELDRYRQILVRKRAELVGDVNRMESEALQNDAGALSNMPSHMAEQGSDASDQSLSLDLAAADRKLIREIDAAIKRIDAGTYGVCEHTGVPIKLERLEELPWARYSIEAAREIERLAMRPS